MDQDIKVKRAQFIDDVQTLQQEFYKCHPEVHISNSDNSACKMLLYTCYRNVKSTTGANVKNIELAVKEIIILENLQKSIHRVVERLHFEQIPLAETWRIAVLKEIALVKQDYLKVEGFTEEEEDRIMRFICSQ